jgi:hypothetical protein
MNSERIPRHTNAVRPHLGAGSFNSDFLGLLNIPIENFNGFPGIPGTIVRYFAMKKRKND